MVSHKRKKCSSSVINQQKTSAVSSSLAQRKILPQSALCRQRYNDAFQALQNAYSTKQQTMRQRQKMSEETAAHPINEAQLTQLKRNLANYRERWRTEELNEAYKQLRRIVPSMPSDKMSKIHTLRIAAEYIRFLDQTFHSLDSCWTTVFICSSSPTFEVSAQSTATIDHVRANFNTWRAELSAAAICQQHQQSELTNRELPKIGKTYRKPFKTNALKFKQIRKNWRESVQLLKTPIDQSHEKSRRNMPILSLLSQWKSMGE